MVWKNQCARRDLLSLFGEKLFYIIRQNIIKQETDFFRIEASIDLNERTEKVVIKSKAGSRKEIETAGKKVERISDHVGRFPCVIIAPDDVQMMLDGSEERRNFLNNTILQTEKDYLEDLLLYNALLKRRNMVLKSFSAKKRVDDFYLNPFRLLCMRLGNVSTKDENYTPNK
ncbi:MAG: hypothetical protein IPN46_19640 [Saprospiraceae bacterium]|nr:hypothetical protein [Saprospiraceae bacterium]